MFQRIFLLAICLTVMTIFVGCSGGDGRPQPVRTVATITFSGSPIEGATVSFSPVGDSGAAAHGKTDADGEVKLTTYEHGDGAVPGSYKVLVSKLLVSEEEEDPNSEDATPYESLLPDRYGNITYTDLTAEVTEDGKNAFTLNLTK